MPSHRAIIEFQEHSCLLYAWEAEKGTHILRSFLRLPLTRPEGGGPGAPECVGANAAALRQAFRAAGLKTREAVVIIPKQWVTLRVVTLPSTEAAELEEMARFEAQLASLE
jgi:hypothetical protein